MAEAQVFGSEYALPKDIEISNIEASMGPYDKKLWNIGATIEEKYNLVRRLGLQKDATAEGYRMGYIVNSPDADSGTIVDSETGNIFDFRTRNIDTYDAVDSYGTVYGDASKPEGSWNKQRSQPRMVAEIVGKDVKDLTPEDFLNVKNYQHEEWIGALTNPNHVFQKYDNTRKYTGVALDENTRIPVMYKVNNSEGTDRFKRNLVDLINPDNGKSVTFDAMQNPYLNVTNMPYVKGDRSEQTFDVFRALDTPENRKRLEEFSSQKGKDFVKSVNKANDHLPMDYTAKASEYVKRYEEGTSLFQQLIDKFSFVGSRASESFSDVVDRWSRHIGDSSNAEKRYIKDLATKNSVNLYDSFINSDTARQLIYQDTQKKAQDAIEEAQKAYNEDRTLEAGWHYLRALGHSISVLPETLGDSAAQTTLGIGAQAAGALAGAKAGAVIGSMGGPIGTAVGGLIGALSGVVLGGVAIATDETFSTMDEYARNNDGKTMSADKIAATFGEHFVAAVPEVILQKIGLGKALGKTPIAKVLFGAEGKYANKINTGKLIAGSAVGEAGQEWLQNTVTAYNAQKEEGKRGFLEVGSDPEQIYGAMAGFLMGGALSGAASGLNAAVNVGKNKRLKAAIEKENDKLDNYTVTGEKADLTVSNDVINRTKQITGEGVTTLEDRKKLIESIEDEASTPGINGRAVATLWNKRQQLLHKWVQETLTEKDETVRTANQDALFKALGMTREEYFSQEVYHSNYNGRGTLETHGKLVTSETREKAAEALKEEGKALGLSEEVVKKTMETVSSEVRYGPYGYTTYANRINQANKDLDEANKTGASNEEANKIVNELTNSIRGVIGLYGNQVSKLQDFVENIESIARQEKKDSKFNYRSGDGSFKIIGSHIANNRYTPNSTYGVYGVINNILKDLDDMGKVLDAQPNQQFVQDLISQYDSTQFRGDSRYARPYQNKKAIESYKTRLRNAIATIQANTKKEYNTKPEGLLSGFSKRGKEVSKAEALGMLQRLAVGTTNDSVATDFTQRLRDFLNKTNVEEFKKAIKERYSAKPEWEKKALSKLTDILELDDANAREIAERQAKRIDTINKINEALKKYDDAFINSVTSLKDAEQNKKIEDAGRAIRYLIKEFAEVTSHSEEDNSLEASLGEVLNKLRDRYRELADKEVQERLKGLQTKANDLLAKYNTAFIRANKANKQAITDAGLEIRKFINELEDAKQTTIPEYGKLQRVRDKLVAVYKKINSKPKPKPADTTEAKNYTLYSGGAEGSDTMWGEIGAEYGLGTINHYYHGQKSKYNAPNGNVAISQEDYEEGRVEVAKAAKVMYNYPHKAMRDPRLIRNWSQVKYADAIFAIGNLITEGTKFSESGHNGKTDDRVAAVDQVAGGTGYAVTMATLHNKPVYVFNQREWKHKDGTVAYKANTWYYYDYQAGTFWEYGDIPTLTKNFAGIGTSKQLSDAGIQAIRDAYEKTFGKPESKPQATSSSQSDTADRVQISSSIQTVTDDKGNEVGKVVATPTQTSPITAILDPLQNNSFNTFKKLLGINLDHQLKLAEHPDSVIPVDTNAYAGVLNETVEVNLTRAGGKNTETGKREYHNGKSETMTFSKLLDRISVNFTANNPRVKWPAMSYGKAGWKVISKPEGAFKQFVKNNIHYAFLYDIKQNSDGTISVTMPEVIKQLIDFSVKEFFASRHFGNSLNTQYLTDDEISRIFGENPETITSHTRQEFREFVSEYGVPLAMFADSLGTLILKNAGITQNKEVCLENTKEKLAVGLGMFALDYAAKLGFINMTEFNPADEENLVKDEETGKVRSKYPDLKLVSSLLGLDGSTDEDTDPNADTIPVDKLKSAGTMTCIRMTKYNENRVKALTEGFNDVKDEETQEVLQQGIISTIKPNKDGRIDRNVIHSNKEDRTKQIDSRKDRVKEVHNGEGISTVGKVPSEVLDDLSKVEYGINTRLADLLEDKATRDRIAKHLGFLTEEEIEALPFYARDGAKGKNKEILDQINGIIRTNREVKYRRTLVEDDPRMLLPRDGGLFFDWFFSRNGRYFIDSSDVNPQTKKLQRFFIMPLSILRDFDINNEDHMRLEAYAIAQAFDNIKNSNEEILEIGKKVNALTLEELQTLQKDFIEKSEKEFVKEYKKYGLKGVENFAQCLNVIDHLITKKKANGKPFKTWLAVENDATTSGYAIRFLNMPLSNRYDLMAKTGILVGNMIDKYGDKSIHELKALNGFDDLYETVAQVVSGGIEEVAPTNKETRAKAVEIFDEHLYGWAIKKGVHDEDMTKIAEQIATIWNTLYSALPKANEDGTVSKALRTLMKYPTMIFGYAGGIKGITELMASETREEYVNVYNKYYNEVKAAGGIDAYLEKNTPKEGKEYVKAIFDTFEKLDEAFLPRGKGEGRVTTIIEAIRKKNLNEMYFKFVSGETERFMSFEKLFYNLLRPTYGELVQQSLKHHFSEHMEWNEDMANTFIAIFQLFKNEYDKRVDEARKAKPNGLLTVKEKEDILFALQDIWPTLGTAYGNTKEDGLITFMRTKRQYSSRGATATQVSNARYSTFFGKNLPSGENGFIQGFTDKSAQANVRDWVTSDRAGAVGPIHWDDGAIMSVVLQVCMDLGILPVHDAYVISALTSDEITKEANEATFTINKDYDIMGTIRDRFFNVIKGTLLLKYDDWTDKEKETINNISDINNLLYATGTRQLPFSSKLKTRIKELMDTPIKSNKNPKEVMKILPRGASKKATATYGLLLRNVLASSLAVAENRRALYKQRIVVGNVDGYGKDARFYYTPNGENDAEIVSVVNSVSDRSNEEKTDTKGSSYRGYQTNASINNTVDRAVTDSTARADLLTDIDDMCRNDGHMTCSTSHMSRLKTLLTAIRPNNVKEMFVRLMKDGKIPSGVYNAGELSRVGDNYVIQLSMDDRTSSTALDPITRQSVYSSMSMAEIYAHECVHAGIGFAITQHINDPTKFHSEVHQLLELQKAGMNVITPEDFMPLVYDKSLEPLYREHAQKTWDYIFNNPNTKGLVGLQEFIAYGLTNERVSNKLAQAKLPAKDVKYKNFADKMIALVKNIFDLLFKQKSLNEALPLFSSILKGNTTFSKTTILQDLERLTYKLSNADYKAANSLFVQKMKPLEGLLDTARKVVKTSNEYLSSGISYITTIADNTSWNNVSKYARTIGATKWDEIKVVGSSLALFAFSAQRRKLLKSWLADVVGCCQQGVIMSVLRDVTDPDAQSQRLELMAMNFRTADTACKEYEAIVYNELSEKFGDTKLNQLQETSLTDIGLRTDLHSLLDDTTTIHDVINYVADDKARQEAIDKYDAILQSHPNYSWIITQVRGLAWFMHTGQGNEHQNLNAANIAQGALRTKSKTKFVVASDEQQAAIDKLATLIALDLANKDQRAVFASLKPEGIKYFLDTHKKFVEDSVNGVKLDDGRVVQVLDQIHAIKGYTKALFDTSYEVTTGFASDRKMFEDQGYTLMGMLPENKITGTTGIAYYRREYATPMRRDGAAVKITGAHSIGTTLRDSAYQLVGTVQNQGKVVNAPQLFDMFKDRANKRAAKLQAVADKKALSMEQIAKLSGGYVPIISPTTGGPVDYRVTMSNDHKLNMLGMDTRGITILSKMFASQLMKTKAPTINKAITQFLIDNMNNNMDQHNRDINTRSKYIKLDKTTTNKYLKESWNVIPKEMLAAASKLPDGLWIREDWLQDLFGVQNYSITEAMPKDSLHNTRRALGIAEMVVKLVSFIAKQNIVVRVPNVLLGNATSNLAYHIMNGTNPVTATSLTLSNLRAMRDYMDTKKTLNRIKFRERIGTATAEEINSKNWLQSKLEHNRVHPLMQKGMYQSIIEDLNPEEMESTNKLVKVLKNSKISKLTPGPVKWMLKQLYMTEGTPIYDFMFTLTQYSDFVARATEYQSQLREIEKETPRFLKNGRENPLWRNKEEELSMMILRAFINYDKPQSRAEQYANDTGLLMFTKFAKRIQSIVVHQATKNPIGVILFLIGQSMLVDVEDIMEQNVFNKHWSALFHNPVENLFNAAIPMPLQYAFGLRHF